MNKPHAREYGMNVLTDGTHSNSLYNSIAGFYNEYLDGLIFIYNKRTEKYTTMDGSATLIKKDGVTVGYSTTSDTLAGNIRQSIG